MLVLGVIPAVGIGREILNDKDSKKFICSVCKTSVVFQDWNMILYMCNLCSSFAYGEDIFVNCSELFPVLK